MTFSDALPAVPKHRWIRMRAHPVVCRPLEVGPSFLAVGKVTLYDVGIVCMEKNV